MKQKLQALWAKLNTDVGELWKNSKFFVIVFGVIIAIIKFRDVLISLLVSSGKDEFTSATKQSDADQAQENKDNAQAAQDVQQAQNLPNSEKLVTDDWYKKQ